MYREIGTYQSRKLSMLEKRVNPQKLTIFNQGFVYKSLIKRNTLSTNAKNRKQLHHIADDGTYHFRENMLG